MKLEAFKITYNGEDVSDYIVLFIVKPLVVLFFFYAFFSRNIGLGGLSGGMTAVLLGTALFGLCFIHLIYRRVFKITPLIALSFFFFLLIPYIAMVSAFAMNIMPRASFQMAVEMTIGFFMFFSVYYLIRERIVTPKFIIYTLATLGLILALYLISQLFTIDTLRRLRSELGAVNVIANSFAVSGFAIMLIAFRNFNLGNKRWFLGALLALLIVLVVMLFVGSRQAIVAFLIGLITLNIFGLKGRQFRKYNLYGIATIVLIIFTVSLFVDLSGWLSRFGYQELSAMAQSRIDIYQRSVADLTLSEFIFGRPDYYIFERQLQQLGRSEFVNPHNIFLSLLRYNGIIPLFLFVLLLGMILFEAMKRRFIGQRNRRYLISEASILVFLLVTLFYTLVSGLMTRSFTLFIAMGYAVGYLELLKMNPPKEEYEKMIL